MKIAVSALKPNPFRDVENYPIDEAKIETLVRSIKDTSFWDNIIARKNDDGEYEIAYGHHRLKALKKARIDEVNIPVRDLSDELMIKIMVNENMEQWGSDFSVMMESVKAVVKAYAEGKLPSMPVPEKTNLSVLRLAPSFVQGSGAAYATARGSRIYTAATIAEFLNWDDVLVSRILKALEMIAARVTKESDFRGLNQKEARTIITVTEKASDTREHLASVREKEAVKAEKAAERLEEEGEKEKARTKKTEAKEHREIATRLRVRGKEVASKVAKKVTEDLKSGKIGHKGAAKSAAEVDSAAAAAKEVKKHKWIDSFARNLIRDIADRFTSRDRALMERVNQLLEAKEYLKPELGEELQKAFKTASSNAVSVGSGFKNCGSGLEVAPRRTPVKELSA